MNEIKVEITEYHDEFTSDTTLWLSEKQLQDVSFITSFYTDSYEKSLLHQVIRFFKRFYK